ncbi:TonB-dependent receptor plug domain-containing protein [Luteimonas aquatica]|uniref:TonB-dependent receptor plug domain-containing protein n=1 Tax=Luteimonas aquatica TaxID=450364 RepID=UPI001F567005|nr:TonB-dependent receptor [Luteimonas aquatica]
MHAARHSRRPLPWALLPLLGLPGLAAAQAQQQAPAQEQPTTLDNVVVTGSRIPRATLEGPSPVTVIKKEDIDAQGFRSVFDAVSALAQNNGAVQGEDFGNTFTPAANTINLRGLGPNHTLILLNGRRLADYPIAYEGSLSIVNLANIPSALIERIEVLAGGASAVYGSDAVAGVVNIILKQRYDGSDLNLRVGGTQEGGGQNQRLQFTSGYSTDRFDAVYGIELLHRKPIWGSQRDFMDSYADDPTGVPGLPYSVFVRRRPDLQRNSYIDPADACAAGGYLAGDTTFRAFNPRQGYFCGSYEGRPKFWTVQTEKKNADAYGALTWHLNDRTDLFADVALGIASIQNNTSVPTWTSDAASNGYFINQGNGNTPEVLQRNFMPEEIGSAHANNRHYLERSWAFTVGAKGTFGDSDWDYEAAYNRGRYENRTRRRAFLTGINEYFLGPKLGEQDGINVYNPDMARFYRPLSPGEYDALTGRYESVNSSWISNFSFTVNGKLFDLPAGGVDLAAVVEAGQQGYSNRPDPRLGQGVFWNSSAGVPARGERDRYAIGAEIKVPVFERLTASAAARYDEFRFAGRKISKSTWNAGLEFRPVDSLLLRATAATSFRAPDMNYVFAAQTRGYNPGMTDYWRCRTAGQPYDDCDYSGLNIDYTSTGNPDLKPENGKSYGIGVVWSPSQNFDLSVDYYNVRLDDQVTDLDTDRILRNEADCRVGSTLGGDPRDINSPLCQDALARVVRNPPDAPVGPNEVRRVLTNAINASYERVSGVDLKTNYRWSGGRYGDFRASLSYNLVIKHEYSQFSDDPITDQRNALDFYDWRSKLNGNLSWERGAWSATLYGIRYGSLPNANGSGRIAPYMLYNGSIGYRFDDKNTLSLIVNNLRNTHPPLDKTGEGGWPFYPVGNYDPYGRQFWLEYNVHFD